MIWDEQDGHVFLFRFTFPSLLKGWAQLLDFSIGKALHGQVIRFVLDSDLYIETTPVNMYAVGGDIGSARIKKVIPSAQNSQFYGI